MGDSLPWMPMNCPAKFDTANFIIGREIHNYTNKQTKKHANSKLASYRAQIVQLSQKLMAARDVSYFGHQQMTSYITLQVLRLLQHHLNIILIQMLSSTTAIFQQSHFALNFSQLFIIPHLFHNLSLIRRLFRATDCPTVTQLAERLPRLKRVKAFNSQEVNA